MPKLACENLRLCIPDREFDVGADRRNEIESAFTDIKKKSLWYCPTILRRTNGVFGKNIWLKKGCDGVGIRQWYLFYIKT